MLSTRNSTDVGEKPRGLAVMLSAPAAGFDCEVVSSIEGRESPLLDQAAATRGRSSTSTRLRARFTEVIDRGIVLVQRR